MPSVATAGLGGSLACLRIFRGASARVLEDALLSTTLSRSRRWRAAARDVARRVLGGALPLYYAVILHAADASTPTFGAIDIWCCHWGHAGSHAWAWSSFGFGGAAFCSQASGDASGWLSALAAWSNMPRVSMNRSGRMVSGSTRRRRVRPSSRAWTTAPSSS